MSGDFLTPKKKLQNIIDDKATQEQTSYEFYETEDSIKEIKHYVAEAQRKKEKRLNTNSGNKNTLSDIPEWALLSVSRTKKR